MHTMSVTEMKLIAHYQDTKSGIAFTELMIGQIGRLIKWE